MFGLGVREKLIAIIEKAIVQELAVYDAAVGRICQLADEHSGEMNDEISNSMADKCAELYFDAVANRVYKEIGGASEKTNMRIMMAGLNPNLCGYPDLNTDRQTAGTVYAICYWALKNKIAQPNDCIYLNRAEEACMHWSLIETTEDWEYLKKRQEEWKRMGPVSYSENARIHLDLKKVPSRPSSLIRCSSKELISRFESGRIEKEDLKDALRGIFFNDPATKITACMILQLLDEQC